MEALRYIEDIETVYTLEDARKIIREENRRKRQEKERMAERKKVIAIYYFKQKLCGLFVLACGIVTPNILEGDATASLLFIPLGLYLVFTRQKVMDF